MKKQMLMLMLVVGMLLVSGCSQTLWFNQTKTLEQAIRDYQECRCDVDDIVHEILVEQGLYATQADYQKYVLINQCMTWKEYNLRCVFNSEITDTNYNSKVPVIGCD